MSNRIPNMKSGDKVIEYNNLQTEEINDSEVRIDENTTKIDENTTKIGSEILVGSILYRLGLIKDYVVESDPNGSWEKWYSGKFVQRGYHNSVVPINIPMGSGYRAAEAVNFNTPFLAGTVPHVMVSSTNYTTVSFQSSTATTFQVGYTSLDSGRMPSRFPYVATGRHK